MNKRTKEGLKAVSAGAAGAAAGAGLHSLIGGIGIAATGTAVGVTLVPFMAIGAAAGLGGYGLYRLGVIAGRSRKKSAENISKSDPQDS